MKWISENSADWKHSTRMKYQNYLERYIIPAWGYRTITEIDEELYKNLILQLKNLSLIHIYNPSIGLLLCKNKNNVVAEYSLKDISKPIGVSEYKITSSLPDALEKQLPSVEDIQKRIK